jgi:hypothetical protein
VKFEEHFLWVARKSWNGAGAYQLPFNTDVVRAEVLALGEEVDTLRLIELMA